MRSVVCGVQGVWGRDTAIIGHNIAKFTMQIQRSGLIEVCKMESVKDKGSPLHFALESMSESDDNRARISIAFGVWRGLCKLQNSFETHLRRLQTLLQPAGTY